MGRLNVYLVQDQLDPSGPMGAETRPKIPRRTVWVGRPTLGGRFLIVTPEELPLTQGRTQLTRKRARAALASLGLQGHDPDRWRAEDVRPTAEEE